MSKQTVSIELDAPNGYRVEWRPPLQGERWMDVNGGIFTADSDFITKRFVLVPLFVAPQWLVDSDYTSIEWIEKWNGWYLIDHSNNFKDTICRTTLHHDLRDMLAGIDPKQTPVAWERGKLTVKIGDVIETVNMHPGVKPQRLVVVKSCYWLAREYVESGAWRVVPPEELKEKEDAS